MGSITGHAEQGEAPIPVILQGLGSKNPDWGNIPVGNVEGQIIYLTDLVTVKHTERPAQSYYRINGKSTLMLTIDAEKGENQIRLANTVRARMLELQKQMPPAWQVILTWDDTDYIRKDLKRVGYRMLFSFIILMLFVALVSRDARYLLLIFITAIANLLLAVVWYHLIHVQIHLYSLAGITVSFGIIIDNSIVMIEHIRQHGNRKIFLAILAATLTTLGSLSVLFMLNAEQQAQLADFAAVVVINLALSLGVAWFLIPALLIQFRMGKGHAVKFTPGQRRKVKISMAYLRCITFTRRYAWVVFMLLIIGFGLPLHLLPSKIEGDDKGASLYNATIGSRFYQYRIKNIAEKTLGGTFRLFSRFVYERSYFSNPERTTLYIRGQMPDGATVHQLNEAVIQMEHFLLQFKEIERFQTRVISPDYSIITIHFYPEFDRGSFPHFLQGYIIHKAISIGGAEWGVWGVGQGFSNVLSSGSGSSTIILEGYNYEQLYRYAEQLVAMAGKNPRVAKLRITGDDPWRNTNRMEFFLHTDPQKLALNGLTLSDVFAGISEKLMYRQGPVVFYNQESVPVRLIADHHLNYSLWDMENLPLFIKGGHFNTKELLSLDKRDMGNDIHKHNQQYRLHVNYNFLGPHQLEERVRTQLRDQINEMLPLGYKARVRTWSWQQDQKQQYLLIFLVLIIIYFICAMLLESLLQPLAIIGLIPVSFVGLFLTFYIFNLNFDQGGWASFILLCGLAVNAGLYILNDYNNFRNTLPGRNNLRQYLKAFQYKITPVLLTISSTLIGLIPFVVGPKEPFWFAFAAGTMGGLAFSLVGIVVFFPVFLKFGSKNI
jgi:multidrug efflux pump subunit AcrB